METVSKSLRYMADGTVKRTTRSEETALQAKAIEAIEKEEGLSDEGLADAAFVISKNPKVANVYVHMKNKNSRRLFLRRHMETLKEEDS